MFAVKNSKKHAICAKNLNRKLTCRNQKRYGKQKQPAPLMESRLSDVSFFYSCKKKLLFVQTFALSEDDQLQPV